MNAPTELTVQGQSLQQLYTQYSIDSYSVNRRYQRKLVWAVEEKQRLIDSVVKNLPIPLVLLAETATEDSATFELIDGLQRMNAVFAFMENEFAYENSYFDLETLADTKLARDEGRLVQKTPLLDRATCTAIANYLLPVSIYRSATEASVDEVFRRINSSGQKLSLQEIRQAGVTSQFASLVREISSFVRGDASVGVLVPLRSMPLISITNQDLPYGIPDESIFWVANGVLDKEAVRESRDEELIVDLLLDMMLDPMTVSGSEYRNSAYGRDTNATASASTVDARVKVLGADLLRDRFIATLDVMKVVVKEAKHPLAQWIITQKNPRGIPRYFHAVFIATYELLFDEDLELTDTAGLAETMRLMWDTTLQMPGGGGNWGANKKRPIFDSIKGLFRAHFSPSSSPLAVRRKESVTQFEVSLQMAVTETSLFELKQGFLRLDTQGLFDSVAFDKVLRTASAMANRGPGSAGRIFWGVADTEADAARVRELHGVVPIEVGRFFVTGTEHELLKIGRNADQHLAWLTSQILNSKLEHDFARQLADSLHMFLYNDRLVWTLDVAAMTEPTTWDNKFYERLGNSTEESTGRAITRLMAKFIKREE